MQLTEHRNKIPHIMAEPGNSANPLKNIALWLPLTILLAIVVIVNLPSSEIKPVDEFSWLNRLASAGDADAQLQVGLAYRDGRYGLNADATKGMQWIKRSAQNGNAYAEYVLGDMYANGQGTGKDQALAFKWWKKAMHDGNHQARVHLIESMVKAGDVQQAETLIQ
jgi:hypothetical protein